jgi:hypothetical protein
MIAPGVVSQLCGASSRKSDASSKYSLYPISISDAEIDHYRRFALLAALVLQYRGTLSLELAAEAKQQTTMEGAEAALNELDHLAGALQSLAARLDASTREIHSVQGQVWNSASGQRLSGLRSNEEL